MVDWIQALVVAGVGFGGVFVILIVLMLSIMAIGFVSRKIAKAAEKLPEESKIK